VALVITLVREKKRKPWFLSFVAFCVLIVVGESMLLTTKTEKAEQKKEVKEEVLEVRVCPRGGINIRTGPGTDYEKDPYGPLGKGEELYIVQDEGDWVRFRFAEKNSDWSGWVRKDLTVSKVQWESIKAEE